MNAKKLDSYRRQLDEMISRIGGDVESIREVALVPAGGQANGELSNAPLHLADSGTDAFHQELNTLLLENEQLLFDQVGHALQRLNEGSFGRCEGCGEPISEERLDAIPYTRCCVKCAEETDLEPPLNLNTGRPSNETETIAAEEKMIVHGEASLDELPIDDDDLLLHDTQDRHAAGTPGGGTAMGGLAGTNVGHGGPEAIQLEAAMGDGSMDDEVSGDLRDVPRASRSGTATGGTPASKRGRNRTGPTRPK